MYKRPNLTGPMDLKSSDSTIIIIYSLLIGNNKSHITVGYYQTQKTVNTWNISGMLIV